MMKQVMAMGLFGLALCWSSPTTRCRDQRETPLSLKETGYE